MKKPPLLTVTPESLVAHGDLLRISGQAWLAIPRQSGRVRIYPYRPAKRGNPFSRPLSPENQERLEMARAAVFGDED